MATEPESAGEVEAGSVGTGTAADAVLKPITSLSKPYIALVLILGGFTLLYAEALVHQLRHGLIVTDMASWGTQAGVTWGLYIGAFEWYAGVALGSIATAAYIRYRQLDQYEMLARIGELWAVISAMAAAFLIVIDLGRPERVIYVMMNWPDTVQHSPLAWDVTFVTTLIVVSVTMLVLSLRRDYGWMDVEFPRHVKPIEKILTLGYQPSEDAKLGSMLRYMGAGMLILVVTAGMVPGWLFGVVGPQPGYYGKIQGVVFITGGIPAGIGAIAVIGYMMRRIYGMEDQIPDETFATFGKALALFTFIYLIVLFNQFMPMVFPMAPLGGAVIAEEMLFGALSTYFWTSVLLMMAVVLWLTALYTYRQISTGATVVASIVVMFAVFIKKNLAVLEPLMFPVGLPYVHGVYSPTLVEWIITLGVLLIAILGFIVAIKFVPMCSGSGPCCEPEDATTDFESADTEVKA